MFVRNKKMISLSTGKKAILVMLPKGRADDINREMWLET